jgi:hypothetical protein
MGDNPSLARWASAFHRRNAKIPEDFSSGIF